MSKIVFFCIPAHGHTNPTLGVVRELISRGHQVFYYSYNMMREKIEATGATLPDRCLIYKFNTFRSSIYFILTNRQYNIKLQSSVSGFHVDTRLGCRQPMYVIFVKDMVKVGFEDEENECSGSKQRKDTIDEAVDRLFDAIFHNASKEE